ncbi:hypothetical protein [Hymenobacter negativus]|uniref:Uncharacterized protein n=1 Tax=Hymenobacter negativus TaxID=2795026 RepID=A0ABS3Q932_9BACT|nr:hypothetical protein [Hymenobacter negativus]MBO2007760.1 hypothetical protein [Hymenobacter negativus]
MNQLYSIINPRLLLAVHQVGTASPSAQTGDAPANDGALEMRRGNISSPVVCTGPPNPLTAGFGIYSSKAAG